MDQAEDAASHGPGFGENNVSQEQENPPPPPPPTRLEAAMALLLENQNVMIFNVATRAGIYKCSAFLGRVVTAWYQS